MANEFFAEAGGSLALRLAPGAPGALRVLVDGETVYDKAEEGGKYPDLPRVKELRRVIRERLAALAAGPG